jgi:RND family efflux transporter MFP subunit
MTRRNAVIAILVTLVAAAAVAATLLLRQARVGGGQASTATAGDHAAHGADAAAVERRDAVPRVEVSLDTRRQQLAGVRTARAMRAVLDPQIRATGTVVVDERRQTEITTRVEGWIRELRADFTGRAVQRGEVLFTLYSPELLAAQDEFLLAVRGHARTLAAPSEDVREYSHRLMEAARERLLRLELTAADIAELEQRGRGLDTLPFRSPASGVIVDKRVVEGQRVMAGETLFRLADLSTVWVEAQVYERELALVRVGQAATVTVDSYPGERFAGRVSYIHPLLDPATRSVKVRVQLPNPRGRMKPGMFAAVELTMPAEAAIGVPADAVLDSGVEQIVFVAQGGGFFEPRRVRTGRQVDGTVEILGGLVEGEEVATGATFFLDSESQLRAAAQGYAAPPAGAPAAPGPPPQAAAARETLEIRLQSRPDPPRSGENALEVTARDAAGRPITDADVTVTFFMAAMPSMNMPAMQNEARLTHAGGGVYRGAGQVMMSGRWDVTVTVSRGGRRIGSRTFGVMAQ